MKVVLDTNVLISAFLFRKRLDAIARHIADGKLTPCFTQSTFSEFREVLGYPHLQPALQEAGLKAAEVVNAVAEASIIVPDPSVIPSIVSDFPDNHILACARAAEASFVVTGDRELLEVREYEGIPIITPKQFITLI